MKVSVIPEDGIIIIDGDVRKPAGVTWPEGVRAMQWSGNSGFIEYRERGQEFIDDIAVVQPFIDLHAAKKALDEMPPPALPLADQRAAAVKKIDTDTDVLIATVIGNRATEYERAEAQATAYAAGGYTGPAPACVQSWADAKAAQGWTAQMAADDILATANAWRPAQDAIRAQRLLRKEQARAAVDSAAVDAVLAQWAGFLVAIRGQLGV